MTERSQIYKEIPACAPGAGAGGNPGNGGKDPGSGGAAACSMPINGGRGGNAPSRAPGSCGRSDKPGSCGRSAKDDATGTGGPPAW